MSASSPDQAWDDAFRDLERLAGLPLEPRLKARACAEPLRALEREDGSRDRREQLAAAAGALEGYARGDKSSMADEFDRIVQTPVEGTGRDCVFALCVKHVHQRNPQPLIVHGSLNRRVRQAQVVLRSRAFLDRLAARLGASRAPEACYRGQVQGVDVRRRAGHGRYAVFFDFIDGVDTGEASSRGGLLLSVVADDFLERDVHLVWQRMPAVAERLRDLGVLNPAATRFLYPIFLTLHDAVGHKVPHALNHPHKRAVPAFLLDPIEEFGADAQFFWACTSAEMRGQCREVMTEAELEALPMLWLMKRLFHYPQRGAEEAPETARLVDDADGRTGLLWWGLLRAEGAVHSDGPRLELDVAALPRVFERALDAWLELERELPRGVEHYRRALAGFTHEYLGAGLGPAMWRLPAALRAT